MATRCMCIVAPAYAHASKMRQRNPQSRAANDTASFYNSDNLQLDPCSPLQGVVTLGMNSEALRLSDQMMHDIETCSEDIPDCSVQRLNKQLLISFLCISSVHAQCVSS